MVKKNKESRNRCSSVGGQAVLEGVMMMGKSSYCTAVRDPDGEIQVERVRYNPPSKAARIPFVRGVVNMFTSLVRGTKALLRSAEVYAQEDEEPGRIEKWFAEKLKLDLMQVVSIISLVVGFALAIALFMWLPIFLVGLIKPLDGTVWEYLVQGVFKLVIFIAYLALVLLLKDMKRLYRYHGAEHKTINCYEKGLPLTVENVMGCSRLHDRCGTSFLFIVIIINILIVGVVYWVCRVRYIQSGVLEALAKLGLEVVLLPVIAGVSYELLKFFARFRGKFSLIFKWPGRLIQKTLTTREPDESMVEVAIAAFNAAMAMDDDPSLKETRFVTGGILSEMLGNTKKQFSAENIDESDAEWIYSICLDVPRSELGKERIVTPAEAKKIAAVAEQRLTGRPLWYIIGDVDFCGCNIKVDERALIPRPETEILAEQAAKTAEEGDKVLDLCTGSGCIAIAIAKYCAGKKLQITASDVSDAAIMLAQENAQRNGADINFVQSDLFSRIHGRFNLIVCNPPYIRSGDIEGLQREVREYEPLVALDGGADGLDFYRRLAKEVTRYIVKGGMLMLEVGEDQAAEVLKLFEKRDYAMIVKDFAGVDRILKIAF